MDFDVNVSQRILEPVDKVFDAVVDPHKMSNYFISSASGPLHVGRVDWTFGDVGVTVSIDVLEVVVHRKIVWESTALGRPVRTTMTFAADGEATVVTVTEGSFPLTDEGVKQALGQNAGWTHMLCGLKAYVQFDINLRTGLKHRLTHVTAG